MKSSFVKLIVILVVNCMFFIFLLIRFFVWFFLIVFVINFKFFGVMIFLFFGIMIYCVLDFCEDFIVFKFCLCGEFVFKVERLKVIIYKC